MAEFNKGDKVLNASSREHGVIIDVMPPRRGRQLYRVSWNGRENDEMEADLIPDVDTTNPFERVKGNLYDSYLDFSKRNTTFKIQNSNNSTVSSLKAARTLFRAYQFKPLLKFLNSVNRRLLVADEVGLGKTIEAGHIMLELKARNQLKNVVIVCPKSLQIKWRDELKFKFGLNFEIYDDKKKLQEAFENRSGAVKAIINYEKIQLRNVKITDEKGKKKIVRVNELLDYIVEQNKRISLVVCDEAHKLRNSDTQTYRGAQRLMDCAEAAVFLTATPVMISTENLYNILHLLDNAKYYNPQIFDNLLEENKPFVRALSQLNAGMELPKIAEQLSACPVTTKYTDAEGTVVLSSETHTVDERFKNYPIYGRLMEALTSGDDSHAAKAHIQQDLSAMSVMNNIFSRTRKRDVTTDLSQPERQPHPCIVGLHDVEQEAYDDVIEQYYDDNSYTNWDGEEVLTQGAQLGLVQRKRQIASSVYAYLNDWDDLDEGIDRFEEYPDSKVEWLERILLELERNGQRKLIVFALFRKTLRYLEIRLGKMGYQCAVIHGGIKEREAEIERFRDDDSVRILLSSEVGSEGLDMQFCNAMVNYDLPWNPMVVEQRIGRIDRFGQLSPVVHIYNFVVAGSIQEDIYTRLLDRIGIFRGTVGDMEAILDAKIEIEGRGSLTIQNLYENLEQDLYYGKLTDEQKERRFQQVEQAIENEQANLKQLEEGLTNALTNDAYFRDEIERMLHHNAYVTEEELYNYIFMVIKQELTHCELRDLGDNIYEFVHAPSAPTELRNFLTRYQPLSDEAEIAFRGFRTSIDEKLSFKLTFHQEKAFADKSLVYVNLYHPIIQACLAYFSKKYEPSVCTFSYALNPDSILPSSKNYFMAVYRLRESRMVQGIMVNSDTLLPLAYDVDRNCLIEDEELSTRLYSQSQTRGLMRSLDYSVVTPDVIQDMRFDLNAAIKAAKTKQIEEEEKQITNNQMRETAQLEEWYKSMKKNLQARINDVQYNIDYYGSYDKEAEHSWRLSLGQLNYQLRKLDEDKAERLSIIMADPQLNVEETLVALNFIHIE